MAIEVTMYIGLNCDTTATSLARSLLHIETQVEEGKCIPSDCQLVRVGLAREKIRTRVRKNACCGIGA